MSLKTKLIILFIAFTLIPVVIFGDAVFSRAKTILEAVRLAQLNNIADLKKNRVESFFGERQGGLRSAQSIQGIKQNLPALSGYRNARTQPSYQKAKAVLDSRLRPFQEAYGYVDVILTDPRGTVVYTSNAEHAAAKLGKSLRDRKAFLEGRQNIYFTDVYFDDDLHKRFEMLGVAPIKDANGNFIGEIAIEIDMGPIYHFIRETTGLGETGEALIDRKDGDSVLFLSPINDDPDAALRKKVAFNDKRAYAAQKAALGETGSGIATDYRGTEVLAAWRYIPSLRWGLVTKINADEAFAPVRTLQTVVLSVGFIMVFCGVFVALAIARTVTRPIQSLQKGAEAISKGDLRQRVGTGAKDEIGQLSRAFDKMTHALIHDIAEREKAEEEVGKLNEDLEHHVRQLEESNKELEAFAYSVSHDLRTPLRSIEGFSLALLEDYADKLDDLGKDYLHRVRNATIRMGQLIDDLLKLSRVTRAEMNRERVDLSAIAKNIAERLKHNHPERSADFAVREDQIAYGDERLLTVMLENLFTNAWKFSEKAPRSVIEFGVTYRDGAKVFFVKDNGIGFDMAYADKLFSPFQRLHKVEEFPGTGIGLATVKRIINRHGGQVWIESEVNKGTTVYFTL